MKSWPTPYVPELPGSGLPLQLFDTSTGRVRPTEPGPTARMYVCGITPYDATHMGHAFTYVVFDLIHRAWLDAGHEVHYVQNVTDIDDPLLERAVATGQDWQEIALRETALFREDMTDLNVIPPRDYIGAVESIPSVAQHVETLRGKGAVYDVDGDLYFRVNSDPEFGHVAHLDLESMKTIFAERGGDPDRPGKEHPLDCLVWQGEKMSKSRGNLVFVSALRRSGVDPNAIRLALLGHHYRSDWAWTDHGLEGAVFRLDNWRNAVDGSVGPPAEATLLRVREALANDLRTPEALDAIDDWVRAEQSGVGDDPTAPDLIRRTADALLGIRI